MESPPSQRHSRRSFGRLSVTSLLALALILSACNDSDSPNDAADLDTVDDFGALDVARDESTDWLVPLAETEVWQLDGYGWIAVPKDLEVDARKDCLVWSAPGSGTPDTCDPAGGSVVVMNGGQDAQPRELLGALGGDLVIEVGDDLDGASAYVTARAPGEVTDQEFSIEKTGRGDYEIRELVFDREILAAFGYCRPDATSEFCDDPEFPDQKSSCAQRSDGNIACLLSNDDRVVVLAGLISRADVTGSRAF